MKNLNEMTVTEKKELLAKCGEIYHEYSKSEKYLIAFQNTDGNIYGVLIDFSVFWKFVKLDKASGSSNGGKIIIRANTGLKNLLALNPFLLCTQTQWNETDGKTNGNKLETLFNKTPDNKNFAQSPDVIYNGYATQLKFFGKSASNVCPVSLLEKLSGKSLI